jgi:hypothetical protein
MSFFRQGLLAGSPHERVVAGWLEAWGSCRALCVALRLFELVSGFLVDHAGEVDTRQVFGVNSLANGVVISGRGRFLEVGEPGWDALFYFFAVFFGSHAFGRGAEFFGIKTGEEPGASAPGLLAGAADAFEVFEQD